MAHYFDIFARHVNQPRMTKLTLRRSSTSRSIGARSDFDASLNGADDEGEVHSVGNFVSADSPNRERERNEANAHIAQYVSEQLQRIRSHDSMAFEDGNGYEARLDSK